MKIAKKILCSLSKRKNSLLGNGFTVENSYGCKWLIDWSNSVDKKMVFKLFEDDQIKFFLNNIYKYNPEFFLDVGAHGGLYSIILKHNFPKLKILSFEPDKQNRYQLYSNLFLNNFENQINVFDYGLSNESKEVLFETGIKANRGSKSIKETGKDTILVKPLDKVFSEKNKICFIKVDVEGHEKEVILGSLSFLKNNRCFIQVEISHENDFKNFNKIMTGLGYSLIHRINDYYYSNIN